MFKFDSEVNRSKDKFKLLIWIILLWTSSSSCFIISPGKWWLDWLMWFQSWSTQSTDGSSGMRNKALFLRFWWVWKIPYIWLSEFTLLCLPLETRHRFFSDESRKFPQKLENHRRQCLHADWLRFAGTWLSSGAPGFILWLFGTNLTAPLGFPKNTGSWLANIKSQWPDVIQ